MHSGKNLFPWNCRLLVDSLGGHTSEEQAILLEFLDFSCFLTVIHAMMWEMPRRQILLEGSFSIARSYHFISKGIKVLFLFGVSFKASFQLVELSLLFSYIQTYIHTYEAFFVGGNFGEPFIDGFGDVFRN